MLTGEGSLRVCAYRGRESEGDPGERVCLQGKGVWGRPRRTCVLTGEGGLVDFTSINRSCWLCAGLAKKRAMLGVGYSPTLSQLLKEAKTEGAVARQVGEGGEQDSTHSPPNYSRFFDEYHGM